MPYSMDNPPKVAKNWTAEEQRKCIAAANATLERGDSEQDAIFACIAAAGKSKKKEGRMVDFIDALKDFVRGIFQEETERQTTDELPDSLKGGRMISRTTIERQDNGQYRAFSVSAVSTKNRVGEIDSRALFDSFIQIAQATGKYPRRDFMHLGRYGDMFVVGDVDYMARSGNVLITSTLYRDNELARAEIAARQANADDWGDSIYYTQLSPGSVERDDDGSVWVSDFGFLQFVSTVPERMAASHFTSGVVQEVDRMSLQKKDLEALAVLFGDEEKARRWLTQHVDNVEEAIEDAGMMSRSVDPDDDPVDEPETTEELVELELDDAALNTIVERVIARLEDQFAKITDSIVSLTQNVELLTNQAKERMTTVDGRLEALEADEEEKQRQWMADMPRQAKSRLLVTHRPSGNPADAPEPTMAERAEAALDGWQVAERYPQ